uniref:Uncharacterized protein n=1 Tax=Cacopsylla melanoneura TaxID=428564 RepID=A0A8D8ZCQ6_9HEMI
MSNFTEDNQIISDFLDPNTLMENLTNSILFQSKDNLKLNDLNRLSVKGGKAKTAGLSNLGNKNTSYDQKENQIQNDNSSQVNGKNRTRSMDITKYIRMKTMLFN